MLPLVDAETKKKKRYHKGQIVTLTEGQAERYMRSDDRDTSRPPAIELVEEQVKEVSESDSSTTKTTTAKAATTKAATDK